MIELEEDLRVPRGNYAGSSSDLITGVTLPAGSRLIITLDAALNSDSIYHGDEFGATLAAICGSAKRPEPEKIKGRLIVSDLEKFCRHKLLVLKFDSIVDSAGKSSNLSANLVTGTVIKNSPQSAQNPLARSELLKPDPAIIIGGNGLKQATVTAQLPKRSNVAVGFLIGGHDKVDLSAGTSLEIEIVEPLQVSCHLCSN